MAEFKKTQSNAWVTDLTPVMVRFQTNDGNIYGWLFKDTICTQYIQEHKRLLIEWSRGTIAAVGPRTLDFYELFSDNKVSFLKPDGVDITLVEFAPRPD